MTLGLVEYVFTKPAETTLTSAALVGATTLDVVDGTVFAGAPSALLPDGSAVTVTGHTATTLTVSAIPVALAATYDVVRVEPAREVKWAGVNIAPDDEFAEAINCRVPHNSQAYLTLADGIYSGTDRTLVEISTFPEPIVVDVKNQQAVHDASTVPIVVRTPLGESVRIDGDGITTYTNDPVPVRAYAGRWWYSAVDAEDAYLYAIARSDGAIHKIDIATGTEVLTGFPIAAPIAGGRQGITTGESGTGVYALNSAGIIKYDASTGAVVGAFSSSLTNVRDIALAPDGSALFVTKLVASIGLKKLNATTGAEVVGSGFPIAGSFNSVTTDGVHLWATDNSTNDIHKFLISTGAEILTGFPIVGNFTDIHVSPDGTDLYATAIDGSSPALPLGIHRFDAATGEEFTESGWPMTTLLGFAAAASNDHMYQVPTDVNWFYGGGPISQLNTTEDHASVLVDSSDGTITNLALVTGDITARGISRLNVLQTPDATFEDRVEVRGVPLPFPYCELRASAATTGIVTATVTKVNLATEVHNDTDFFSVSASVITVAEAGVYDIQGSGTWSLSGTPTLQWGITKNGTATFITANGVAPATFFQSSLAALGVTLAAGDTVRLCAFQTTGSNQSTFHDANNQARLIIRRVA